MTRSTHTYRAWLLGTPNIELSVEGGRVTLDESAAPHVQASIDIAIPEAATLAALDPREDARVRIDVTAVFPSGTQTRSFNLGLRDRDVRHRDGVVTLTLASDEALLADYAPLADDTGAFALQNSLRAVVNYILGKAAPGAVLQATPANNADATVYADATQLFPNPRVSTFAGLTAVNCTLAFDTTYPGAIGGVAHNGAQLTASANNASYVAVGGDGGGIRLGMQPGRTYVFSATGRVKTVVGGIPANQESRRLIAYYRVGTGAYQQVMSPQLANVAGTQARVSVEFTPPEGATEIFLRAFLGGTSGVVTWGHWQVQEKNPTPGFDNTAHFCGDEVDTAAYLYEWTGAADASTSTRRALIDRTPDVLLWRAGTSALDLLIPLVQAYGFRLVCDETRKWTLRSEDYAAPGAIAIRHGVNLVDGTDTISRDSGLWYDARVTRYTWRDSLGRDREQDDTYALTTPYTRLTLLEVNAPYPGPGRSEYAVRRAQERGREVTATAVADWIAQAEQSSTFVLDGAPTQIGKVSRVIFDLTTDEMTVTSRTTDTPAGAIDLLTGTIDALTGTIDNL